MGEQSEMKKHRHKFKCIKTRKTKDIGLNDCLQGYGLSDLKNIVRRYHFKNYHKRRKSELIEMIKEKVCNEKELYELMLSINSKEFRLANKLSKKKSIPYTENQASVLISLIHYSYVFPLDIDGVFLLYMPTLVRKIFQKINSPAFSKKRNHYRLIWDYYCACVNLFGVITPKSIVKIYNAHNHRKITEDELLTVLFIFSNKGKPLYLDDNYFVHRCLTSSASAEFILKEQKKAPLHIPSKEELMEYVDEDFYELPSEVLELLH